MKTAGVLLGRPREVRIRHNMGGYSSDLNKNEAAKVSEKANFSPYESKRSYVVAWPLR